jgi:hypothetical protein
MTAPGHPIKERDPRPHRLGWAPGDYLNRCRDCQRKFVGDKRARQCADCAYAAPDPVVTAPEQPTPQTALDVAHRVRNRLAADFFLTLIEAATEIERFANDRAAQRAAEAAGEIRRLRDAIVSARWRLAKGRALWNGPCHQCDAALERGLTGKDIRDQASNLELAALGAPTPPPGDARRDGHSKLVYDKDRRTLVTVDPHPPEPPPGDARERARTIIKQRYEQDCFLCCIAMALDLDYDEALAKWGAELVDHVAAHGLVGRKNIDRAFSALGLQRDLDYVTILMEFPGPEPWERAEIRKLLWGRRACIQVRSKNYENRFHVVYWDGERLIDPSNLKTYSDMGEVEPIFVWIFDERCALQSERPAAASQAHPDEARSRSSPRNVNRFLT